MSQQAAPGNNPGQCFICGSGSFTPGHKAAKRWIIPGSRLFLHVSAGLVLGRIREGGKVRAKAAPLQALDNRVSHRRATSQSRTRTITIPLATNHIHRDLHPLPYNGRTVTEVADLTLGTASSRQCLLPHVQKSVFVAFVAFCQKIPLRHEKSEPPFTASVWPVI